MRTKYSRVYVDRLDKGQDGHIWVDSWHSDLVLRLMAMARAAMVTVTWMASGRRCATTVTLET